MTPIASGSYRPTSATSQELANLLARFAESAGIDTKDVRISVSYVYEDGGRDVTGVDPLDFAGLIALAPPISLISLKSLQPQTSGLSLYVHADRIDLEAGGESLSAAQALVQKAALAWRSNHTCRRPRVVSSLSNGGSTLFRPSRRSGFACNAPSSIARWAPTRQQLRRWSASSRLRASRLFRRDPMSRAGWTTKLAPSRWTPQTSHYSW
jgi:hypothetical protein